MVYNFNTIKLYS